MEYFEKVLPQQCKNSPFDCKKHPEYYDPETYLLNVMKPYEGNLIMCACGTVFMILFWVIDSMQQKAYRNGRGGFKGIKKFKIDPDEDVLREEKIVKKSDNDKYLIKAVNLCKQYPNNSNNTAAV